jgi:hypothetical protein
MWSVKCSPPPTGRHLPDIRGIAWRPPSRTMPVPAPPFDRNCPHHSRGFAEQAMGHPEGDALTEAARAIWRGIEVLEAWNGADERARLAPCVPCLEHYLGRRHPVASCRLIQRGLGHHPDINDGSYG